MCTLLTQNICLMCHTQLLDLSLNKIGDAGLTALAKAVESGALPQLKKLWLQQNNISDSGVSALADAVGKGALDQLTVCWCPTALSPCLETPHVHSPDSEHLFDVPYAVA
jgi:Leucine-rich repeat (LRR) protein